MTRYGAYREDWVFWANEMGCATELLPVIANPQAEYDSSSILKKSSSVIGKVPSRYLVNARRGIGITNWPSYKATEDELYQWANEPDYGICLITRVYHAIDIDVDDRGIVSNILEIIRATLGPAPIRTRADSERVLVLYKPLQPTGKRILNLGDKGMVELLGVGNQCVIEGTHKKGSRYEWSGRSIKPPEVSNEVIEKLIQEIRDSLGILGDTSFNVPRLRDTSDPVDENDPVIPYINKIIRGRGVDGRYYIFCPFQNNHTKGSKDNKTETVYFPRGHGYSQGHFKCLHAHCAEKTDEDFLQAIGYEEAMLLDTLQSTEKVLAIPLEQFNGFQRVASTGRIKPSYNNLYLALSRPELCGYRFRFDSFLNQIQLRPFISDKDDLTDASLWREMTLTDCVGIAVALSDRARGFDTNANMKMLIRDIVELVVKKYPFDSATHWITGLKWDGVPRVTTFLPELLKTEDTPYTRAVGRYMWSTMAARAAGSGVRADMIPVFISPEGYGKTSVIPKLAVSPDFHTTISFRQEFRDIVWNMRGRLIAEIPELDGLSKRDQEAVKAFITRDTDDYREHYETSSTRDPRRWFLIATSNYTDVLSGITGNRRWLPVTILSPIDVVRVSREALQLWAEGYQLYLENGSTPLYQEAEELAKEVIEEHRVASPLEEQVRAYTSKIKERKDISATELFADITRGSPVRLDLNMKEFYALLRSVGWKPCKVFIGQRQVRLWRYDPID
jgi:Virulence-associated protein E/Bifunctional DNA primase/polymerase, N-terminal